MIRVACIAGTSDYTGGSRVVLSYLRSLPPNSYAVTKLVCPARPDGSATGLAAEARVRGIEVLETPAVDSWIPIRQARALADELREESVEVLVASNIQNALRFASIVRGWHPSMRLVAIANNELTFGGFGALDPLKRVASRRFVKRADAVVFVSQALLKSVIGSSEAAHGRFHVIPNSVDTKRLQSGTQARGEVRRVLKEEYGIPIDAPLVGYNARVTQQKDLVTFVNVAARACKVHAAAHFYVAGDAQTSGDRTYADTVVGLLRSLDLEGRVHLLGWRSDAVGLLNGADVYLSTARWEGFPLGVVEAMAMGLPIVTSAFGSAKELVEDGATGFVRAPGDADGLARCTLDLINDPALRMRLGHAGRQLAVTRFDTAQANQRFSAILEGLGRR